MIYVWRSFSSGIALHLVFQEKERERETLEATGCAVWTNVCIPNGD